LSKLLKTQSKFLSLVLRHSPQKIGIVLDKNGWVSVSSLLKAASANGQNISLERLSEIVEDNDKQRFSFSEDGQRIRANQGHSIKEVDLQLAPVRPPKFLYHGTVDKFIPLIQESGLKKMNRQHVHLSSTVETASTVGARRGKPVILSVQAEEMHESGHQFYLSKNNVWLTDNVPWKFITYENV
jgi:putative RNA 2'-phosphotransferase